MLSLVPHGWVCRHLRPKAHVSWSFFAFLLFAPVYVVKLLPWKGGQNFVGTRFFVALL